MFLLPAGIGSRQVAVGGRKEAEGALWGFRLEKSEVLHVAPSGCVPVPPSPVHRPVLRVTGAKRKGEWEREERPAG